MLPAPLVGAYQQYKRDTDSIAGWLASTARSNGYQNPETKPKGSRRLKGKARQTEKKTQKTYRIPIRDFTALARFICGLGQVVPLSVSSTLDRLIKGRSDFADRMATHGVPSDTVADQRHLFFVEVIKEVREILEPRFEKKKKVAQTTNPVEEATNRFAGLYVHEPAISSPSFPSDINDSDRPTQAVGDSSCYVAEQDESWDEYSYAVPIMMHDLQRVRSRVKLVWEAYKSGEIDLMAAALATNTAVDFARALVDDVAVLIEKHGGIWMAVTRNFTAQAQVMGYTEHQISTISVPGDSLSLDDNLGELYDVSVNTFHSASRILLAMADVVQSKELALSSNTEPLVHASDRDNKSVSERSHEDLRIASAFFKELSVITDWVAIYPVQDELLRGMTEWCEIGKPGFHMAFATQIFLDIHHIMLDKVDVAFQTLETNAKRICSDLEQCLASHDELSLPFNEVECSDQIDLIRFILQDPLHMIRSQAHIREHGGETPPQFEYHTMLKLSPVLSGLMLYHIQWRHRSFGLKVARCSSSMTAAVHLYNALDSQKLLKEEWYYITAVRRLLGDTNFFVGSAPTSMKDCSRKYLLQQGLSAAAMTSRRRDNTNLRSRRGARTIEYEDRIPITSIFADRYVARSGRVDWTAERIEHIIANKDDTTTRRSKRTIQGTTYTPDQVIGRLALALSEESVELSFPWVRAHLSCLDFLSAAMTKCEEKLGHYFGSRSPLSDDAYTVGVGIALIKASSGDMELIRLMAEAVLKGPGNAP